MYAPKTFDELIQLMDEAQKPHTIYDYEFEVDMPILDNAGFIVMANIEFDHEEVDVSRPSEDRARYVLVKVPAHFSRVEVIGPDPDNPDPNAEYVIVKDNSIADLAIAKAWEMAKSRDYNY